MAFATRAIVAACTLYVLKFLATCVYNLFFHPLHKHPGPLLWRATIIPQQWSVVSGNIGRDAEELHGKYGPVVRVAPNALSFTEPQAWPDMIKPRGRREMAKDESIFGLDRPTSGWELVSAPAEHHARIRRVFAPAFSRSALLAHEALLVRNADQMVAKMGQLQERIGQVDAVALLNFTSIDIMAEFTFGQSLGMLEKNDYVPWARAIFFGVKYVVIRAVLLGIPVLGRLLDWTTTGVLRKKMEEHFVFVRELLDKRLSSTDATKPDMWTSVLKSDEDGKGLSKDEIYANGSMFMAAGMETTSTTLAGAVYHLGRNPRVYAKLVKEIRPRFKTSGDMADGALSEMVYLNAVLTETLRIYPPGGNGQTRIVPVQGAEICGERIPGGTVVTMATHAANRHPSNFHRPKEFLPERWIEADDAAFASERKNVFQPFSFGRRSCIGKDWALMEMRLVLAKMLWHWDLQLLPGMEKWTDQRSYLLWEKRPLLMRLYPVRR